MPYHVVFPKSKDTKYVFIIIYIFRGNLKAEIIYISNVPLLGGYILINVRNYAKLHQTSKE